MGTMRVRSHLVNRPGKVLMLSMELAGLRAENPASKRANTVKDLAKFLKKRGVEDIAVVVPNSQIDSSYKPIETIQVGKGLPAVTRGVVDGVEVFAVKDEINAIYPAKSSAGLIGITYFAENFWAAINNGAFGNVGLVHGFDWPAGLVFSSRPQENENVKLVFTPFDPIHSDTVLPGSVTGAPYTFLHKGGTSGFMAGLHLADVVAVWSEQQLLDWQSGNDYSQIFSRFLRVNREKIMGLGERWTPESTTQLPWTITARTMKAYLQALYGIGHEFSVNLIPSQGKIGPGADKSVMGVTDKNPEDPRRDVLLPRLKEAHPEIPIIEAAVKYVPNYPKPVYQGYKGMVGAIVQILEKIFVGKDYNPESNYFAFLNGGDGERGFVATLHSCAKGELRIGARTMSDISQDSAHIVASQLPHQGDGWVVMFGCDNYFMPNGPIMVGDHLLSEAKQGVILLGQPTPIKGKTATELQENKPFGLLFIDPKSGDVLAFGEKKVKPGTELFDAEWAWDTQARTQGTALRNTFFFVMRTDVAKIWFDGFMKESALNGKPLHETYDLDFSSIFTTAAFASKEEWMAKYTEKYAMADWMFFWELAQKIKEKGIGGGDIGEGEDSWADVGTIGQQVKRYQKILLPKQTNGLEREIARKFMGIKESPESDQVFRSVVTNVELPEEGDFYIGRSVFKRGGKVGKNCIIIDSVFEDKVDIPDNTIIIGSRLYNVQFDPNDKLDKFIYHVHQSDASDVLKIKGNCAYSTIWFINGNKETGVFPISLDGREVEFIPGDPSKKHQLDRTLQAYQMNGKMVWQPIVNAYQAPVEQEVTRITLTDDQLTSRLENFKVDTASTSRGSVKNLKRINSLKHSDQADRAVIKDIEDILNALHI